MVLISNGIRIVPGKGRISVPLRGLWFLSGDFCVACDYFYYDYFRPLAGIMVLICMDWLEDLFPLINDISVPLRGLWFLSKKSKPNGILTLYISVPLRGLWFLSREDDNHDRRRKEKFPSPCGDYGSYRDSYNYVYASITRNFRPLAGIMVLIMLYRPLITSISHFRPLAGIMVLIRTLYRWLYEAVEMAFCGADHIFSSFFVFCRKMIFKKSFRLEF